MMALFINKKEGSIRLLGSAILSYLNVFQFTYDQNKWSKIKR